MIWNVVCTGHDGRKFYFPFRTRDSARHYRKAFAIDTRFVSSRIVKGN